MFGSWSEDDWQSVAQVMPEFKNRQTFRLYIESMFLVMQDPKLDIAHDPEGKYPANSLQAKVRQWHQDGTLHRLIGVFEDSGLSKGWPEALEFESASIGQIGLRELIVRTLLEVRNLPVPKERPILVARSEEAWQAIFRSLPELVDSERSRYVLSSLDTFMRDPNCRWSDLGETNADRVNSAINNWEHRGLLATIIRQLTYCGVTSEWVDTITLGERTAKRRSIRHKIVLHLQKARKLSTARERRKQKAQSKKPFTWKSAMKNTPGNRGSETAKQIVAQTIVNQTSSPEQNATSIASPITAADIEILRARRALRKAKSNSTPAVSRRERERLKGMQRPTR